VFVALGTPHLHYACGAPVSQVGGSLRDVQELAGHTSLAKTQRYIEGDTEAKRKLVALL
jgi:integrase/recombinase XerD